MNLDAIAEGIAHIESFPGSAAVFFSLNAGCLQLFTQIVQVGTFDSEMALHIKTGMSLFNGYMDIKSAGGEPNATANAHHLGLGNLAQSELAGVEGARDLLAALGHADIDV